MEASWVVLGRLGVFLGELGGILDPLGPSWRPSWTILGGIGGHLGPSWRPSWANVAILEAILSRLGGKIRNWAMDWASYGSCGGPKGDDWGALRVAGGTCRSLRGSSFGNVPPKRARVLQTTSDTGHKKRNNTAMVRTGGKYNAQQLTSRREYAAKG